MRYFYSIANNGRKADINQFSMHYQPSKRDKPMNFIRPALTGAFILIVCGCSGNESAAKHAVRDSLKDPDSAKFGQFTDTGGGFACIGVNAKNAMGGYTGEQQASLIKSKAGWHVFLIEDMSHADCLALPDDPNQKKNIEGLRALYDEAAK